LVLATLKVADELSDAYDEIKRLRTALEDRSRGESDVPAGVLEQAAQRIEAIAAALESA
jgi:cell division protein ZapA (FtsZ GTPase activity inhibitor)